MNKLALLTLVAFIAMASSSDPPTSVPSAVPTSVPTSSTPTSVPTTVPTSVPTSSTPTSVPTTVPTSVPTSSTPTSVPTAVPTSVPTSSAPSSAPTTSAPSFSPTTSVPTAVPTSFPTALPTEVSAQHINVHLVDLHGDGWYDDLYLVVHHNNTYGTHQEPTYYSLHCACKVVRIFSQTGNMTLSMYRNLSAPVNMTSHLKHAPFEWEALWAVGYSDGVVFTSWNVYGDVDTVMHVVNWELGNTHHLLDTDNYAPKNRCSKPSPKRRALTSEDNEDALSPAPKGKGKPKPPPPPPVDISFQLGESHRNAWCDDSGDVHSYFCSKEGDLSPDATLPNLLTYPRYFIADTDTNKVIQVGTLDLDVRQKSVTVPLPSEGSFVFSVSGHYLAGNELTWNFCGLSGTISERVHFRMRNGLCEATDFVPLDSSSGDQCDGEWSTGHLLLSPVIPLAESDTLATIHYDINVFTYVAAALGLVALGLVLVSMRNYQSPSNRGFTRVDTTQHAMP